MCSWRVAPQRPRAYGWPGQARLLTLVDDVVSLVGFGGQQSATLDGVWSAAVRRWLEGEEPSGELRALEALLPWAASWLRERPRPLTRADALALDGFDTLFLELVGRCNERCIHCYAGSGPEVRTALPREVCFNAVRDARALGFSRVQLTGGDPLLCDFLVEVVAQVRAHQMTPEIYTNGLLLKGDLVAALHPYAPRLAFSLYSHDAETHDRITRTAGSHTRTLAAIERALAAGWPVRVSMTIMDLNATHRDATVAFLRARGVQDIGVASSHAVGRGERFVASTPDDAVHRASAPLGASRLWGTLAVLASGEVTPCIFNRGEVLGSALEQPLVDIVRAPRTTRLPVVDDALASCRDRLQCVSCRMTHVALALA